VPDKISVRIDGEYVAAPRRANDPGGGAGGREVYSDAVLAGEHPGGGARAGCASWKYPESDGSFRPAPRRCRMA